MLLAILLVASLVTIGVVMRGPRVDPHFVAAQRILAGYEEGRQPDQRNYNNPIYSEALAELALVDSGSTSAAEADSLAAFLTMRIREFQAMMNKKDARLAAWRENRRQYYERVYFAQEQARLNPVTSFPECENDGHGGHSHKH